MIYRKYKIEKKILASLSKEEKSVLKILEEVVKDISVVYQLQIKEGFYPKDLSKTQLVKEAKTNPELLSPYTYVQSKNGKLEAIPYQVCYSKYLQPITKKIEKAASLTTNKSFKKYLQARANSLLDGDYRTSFVLWLDVKNSKIDFSIGPFERYLDKLQLIKRTFQAHVGIVDPRYTKLAESYKETLYSTAKLGFSKYHSTDIPKKGVSVFVEYTPALSGYPADILALGEHFPSNTDLARQYGSKIILYASQINYKFDEVFYPIFQTIFEPTFASKYPKRLLLDATYWCIFLFEVGQQLHKFDSASERLKELYVPIYKANGFASGIEHSKHLVVKGLISQEMLEAIMIVHVVWMLSDWILFEKHIAKQSHIIGNSLLLNSYLFSGALRESAGISWPNFSKIFFEIEAKAYELTYLLQKGSYEEAQQFIKKNSNLENFERLFKSLSKISTKV